MKHNFTVEEVNLICIFANESKAFTLESRNEVIADIERALTYLDDTNYEKTAAYLDNVAEKSGYSITDYYIYAITGSEDIAYEPLSGQIEAMKEYGERFVFNPDFTKGNFYYGVIEGAEHDYPSMLHYIYNALPNFWMETDGK